ncbi:MAG: DUF2752 domain-containing protein [Acidobacteriota bacterium]|nr:MAG: DUF2752 domain-containing protein [Acidobacteriota bacterium]
MTGIPAQFRLGWEARGVFTSTDRLVYLLVACGSIAAIVTGRFLTPSATGVGTHEQLGLPACPTLQLTGFPCPSCGLTTSFALAARLDFNSALLVQPFGLAAFILAIALIPVSFYLMLRRIPVNDLIFSRGSNPILYLLLALYLAGWMYKIVIMSL